MSLAINNNMPDTNSIYSAALTKNITKAAANYASKETAKESAKETKQSTNNKDVAATYEGSQKETKGLYSINQMNQADRTQVANRLMQEFEEKKGTMSSIVQQLFTKQGNVSNLASLFTPDKLSNISAEDVKKAKEDISEDGYFGIKQTSQRLFDFASALAGDDPEKMKKMEEAMEKGFKKAEKAWGKELPEISHKTMDAARQLFKDYYQSKKDIFTE